MEVTALGLATDLMVLRLGGSIVEDRGDHIVFRTPTNPHYWWGNGIALPTPPAPDDVARWLGVFAAEFPEAAHVAIALDTAPDAEDGSGADPADHQPADPPWLRPWRDLGFDYHADLALSTSDPRPPVRPTPDAQCRPLTTDADWADLVDLRCADPLSVGEHDPGEYRDHVQGRADTARAMVDAGYGQWFGAFVDGRLRSSMGLFTDGSGLARYQAVDTHPDFRRRGLAGTLLHVAGRYALTEMGARRLVIVAEIGGPAIGTYRAGGFVDTSWSLQLERRPA
jgi:GNAT superfamily N-acetyltransferase